MAKQKTEADEIDIEATTEEFEDDELEPVQYDIVTSPTDFTLEGLNAKWKAKAIVMPQFQRKLAWNIKQSSKLIESFLLGLPVPPVYLFLERGKHLVVDGQQRLKSVAYFYEGFWGEETNGKRPVFRLTGLNKKSPFFNKTLAQIKEDDEASYNKFNDTVLRAFVIRQIEPKDDTSIYHVFARLNTGSVKLTSQELRNCIYHGAFNDLLIKLNGLKEWRLIVGKKDEDRRRRDTELILRFFALHFRADKYARPLTDFLSKFMAINRNPSKEKLKEYEELFQKTTSVIIDSLGSKPFHIRAGMNIAAFDAVATAFASHLDRIPADIVRRYAKLKKSTIFLDYTTSRTTNEEVMRDRLSIAANTLFGKKK